MLVLSMHRARIGGLYIARSDVLTTNIVRRTKGRNAMGALHRTIGRDKNRQGRNKTKTSSPQTPETALRSLKSIRLYCAECQTVQGIKDVTAVDQHPSAYSSAVILGCGHARTVSIAVKRLKSTAEEVKIGDCEDETIDNKIGAAVS